MSKSIITINGPDQPKAPEKSPMQSGNFYRHKKEGYLVFVASNSGAGRTVKYANHNYPAPEFTPVVQIGGANNGWSLIGLFRAEDEYELVDVQIKVTRPV